MLACDALTYWLKLKETMLDGTEWEGQRDVAPALREKSDVVEDLLEENQVVLCKKIWNLSDDCNHQQNLVDVWDQFPFQNLLSFFVFLIQDLVS